MWCGEAVAVEQVVPHSRVVDKNQEEYLRSELSQPQARPHSPSFQWQEVTGNRASARQTSRNQAAAFSPPQALPQYRATKQ